MISIIFRYSILALLSLSAIQVNSQLCQGVSQYGRCSLNSACGCFHMEGASDIGVCGFQWVTCGDLPSCSQPYNQCPADTICVRHPRCRDSPVCFPAAMIESSLCPPVKNFVPLRAGAFDIPPNAVWQENAITVAEGYQLPDGTNITNGLYFPMGLFVDDEQTVYATDPNNNRVMEIKASQTRGRVAAGGNGRGNGSHQLFGPSDVIVDKETDSLIICDNSNKRIVRWPRQGGVSGETIISNVSCHGLTMDQYGSIYAAGYDTHEVRRYRKGESVATVVAGGNGRGSGLNQLNWPQCVFVDRDLSVYVSEWYNGRVTKWVEGAKEGIVVAGGKGQGSSLSQLHAPIGVVVDQRGTVYVADGPNNRIVRWPKGATQGTVIAGGNGQGKQPNQLAHPMAISFDRYNNLYVVDHWNHRVQKFSIV